MTNWNISYASVTGVSHKQSKLPCQDSAYTKLSKDKKWIACVVSDGAGSAKHSKIGSKLLTFKFSESLINLSDHISSRGWDFEYEEFILDAIDNFREELKQKAKTEDLREYHCTLVAILMGESEGLSIHLGDGANFGGSITLSGENKVSLSKDTYISLPENGQYANETFFVTEQDWKNHLRIERIKNIDWFVSATDGGTALAMINDKEPKPGFIKPVIQKLTNESSEKNRNMLLKVILSDLQANKLTSDDKTLAIIYRDNLLNNNIEIEMNEATQKTSTYKSPPSMLRKKEEEKRLSVTDKFSHTKVYVQEELDSTLKIFLCVFILFESLIVLSLQFAPEISIEILNKIIRFF